MKRRRLINKLKMKNKKKKNYLHYILILNYELINLKYKLLHYQYFYLEEDLKSKKQHFQYLFKKKN